MPVSHYLDKIITLSNANILQTVVLIAQNFIFYPNASIERFINQNKQQTFKIWISAEHLVKTSNKPDL